MNSDQDYPMDQNEDGAGSHPLHTQKRKREGHEDTLPRKKARMEGADEGAYSESESNDDNTNSESEDEAQRATTVQNPVTSWPRQVANLPQTVAKTRPELVESEESRWDTVEHKAPVSHANSSTRSFSDTIVGRDTQTSARFERMHATATPGSTSSATRDEPDGAQTSFFSAYPTSRPLHTNGKENKELNAPALATERAEENTDMSETSGIESSQTLSHPPTDHGGTKEHMSHIQHSLHSQMTSPFTPPVEGIDDIEEPNPGVESASLKALDGGKVHIDRALVIHQDFSSSPLSRPDNSNRMSANQEPSILASSVALSGNNKRHAPEPSPEQTPSIPNFDASLAALRTPFLILPVNQGAGRQISLTNNTSDVDVANASTFARPADNGELHPKLLPAHVTNEQDYSSSDFRAGGYPALKTSETFIPRQLMADKKTCLASPVAGDARVASAANNDSEMLAESGVKPTVYQTHTLSAERGTLTHEDQRIHADKSISASNPGNVAAFPSFKSSKSGKIRIGLPPAALEKAFVPSSTCTASHPVSVANEDSEMMTEPPVRSTVPQAPTLLSPATGNNNNRSYKNDRVSSDNSMEESIEGTAETYPIPIGRAPVVSKQPLLPPLPSSLAPSAPAVNEDCEMMTEPPVQSTVHQAFTSSSSTDGGTQTYEDHPDYTNNSMRMSNIEASDSYPFFKASKSGKIRIGLPPAVSEKTSVPSSTRSASHTVSIADGDLDMLAESGAKPTMLAESGVKPTLHQMHVLSAERGTLTHEDQPVHADKSISASNPGNVAAFPSFKSSKSGKIRIGLPPAALEKAFIPSSTCTTSHPVSVANEDSEMMTESPVQSTVHQVFTLSSSTDGGTQTREDHLDNADSSMEMSNVGIPNSYPLFKASESGKIHIGLPPAVFEKASVPSSTRCASHTVSNTDEDSEMMTESPMQSTVPQASTLSSLAEGNSQTHKNDCVNSDDSMEESIEGTAETYPIPIGRAPVVSKQPLLSPLPSSLAPSAPAVNEDCEMMTEPPVQSAVHQAFTSSSSTDGGSQTYKDHPDYANNSMKTSNIEVSNSYPLFKASKSGKIRIGLPPAALEKAFVLSSTCTTSHPVSVANEDSEMMTESPVQSTVHQVFTSSSSADGGTQTREDHLDNADSSMEMSNVGIPNSYPLFKASESGKIHIGLPPAVFEKASVPSSTRCASRTVSNTDEDSEMMTESPMQSTVPQALTLSTSGEGDTRAHKNDRVSSDNSMEKPIEGTAETYPIPIGQTPVVFKQPLLPPLPSSLTPPASTANEDSEMLTDFLEQSQSTQMLMPSASAKQGVSNLENSVASPSFEASESGKIHIGLPFVVFKKALFPSSTHSASHAVTVANEDSEMLTESPVQSTVSQMHTIFSSAEGGAAAHVNHPIPVDNNIGPSNARDFTAFSSFNTSESGKIRIALPPVVLKKAVPSSPLSSLVTLASTAITQQPVALRALMPSSSAAGGPQINNNHSIPAGDGIGAPLVGISRASALLKTSKNGKKSIGLPPVVYEQPFSSSSAIKQSSQLPPAWPYQPDGTIPPMLKDTTNAGPNADTSGGSASLNTSPSGKIRIPLPPMVPSLLSCDPNPIASIADQILGPPALSRNGSQPPEQTVPLQMEVESWPEHALNQLKKCLDPLHAPVNHASRIQIPLLDGALQPLIDVSDATTAFETSHAAPVLPLCDDGSDIYMPLTDDIIQTQVNHTMPASKPSHGSGIRLPLPRISRYDITDNGPTATHNNSWNNQPRVIYVNGNRPPNAVTTVSPEAGMRRRLRRNSEGWDDSALPQPNPEEADDEHEESDDDNDCVQFTSRSSHRQPSLDFDTRNRVDDHLNSVNQPPLMRDFRDPRLDQLATLRDVMNLQCCHKTLEKDVNETSSSDEGTGLRTSYRRQKKRKSPEANAWNKKVRKFAAKLMKRTPLPGHYSLKGASITSVGLSRLKKYFQSNSPSDGPCMERFELCLDDAIIQSHRKESRLWNARAVVVFVHAFMNDNPEVENEAVEKAFKTHINTLEEHFRVSLQDDSDIAEDKMAAATEQRQRSRCNRRSYLAKIIPQLKQYKELLEHLPVTACSGDEFDVESGKLFITTLPWRSKAVRPWMDVLEKVHLSIRFPDGKHPTTGSFPLQRIDPPCPIIDDEAPVATGLPENFYDPEWLALQSELERGLLRIKPSIDLKFDHQILSMAKRAANITGPKTPPEPPTY